MSVMAKVFFYNSQALRYFLADKHVTRSFNNPVHLEKVTSPPKYTTIEFDINSSK